MLQLLFASPRAVSHAFSARRVYSKFGHHPHPLGYLCAKFCLCHNLHCWDSQWKKITQPAYLMSRKLKHLHFGTINKLQKWENLRTILFGLNGSICVTSGLGSFDISLSSSGSVEILAESALVDSWTFGSCWNNSCKTTRNLTLRFCCTLSVHYEWHQNNGRY